MRSPLTIAVVVLLALCGSAFPVSGQVLYGSLVGNVTDESGAAIPGATVTITHRETGASRDTTTDSTGAYRFLTVPSGTYTVLVRLEGFRTFSRADVPVTLNNATRVDAALPVGQLAETVTVGAETPLLQTERAEVRAELKTRDFVNLPVSLNRNYQYLFRVLPGFTPPAEAHSVPSNPSRALVFNVNGASRSSNNIRIDGVSTTNVWLPHVAAYVPALESLEAVNIVTSSFDAEQGLAGGSAINVQIKSGTNNIRGSAFEYLHERAAAHAELLRSGGHSQRRLELQPVRRHRRRADRAQQAVLLRQLRRHPRSAAAESNRVGANGGNARGRSASLTVGHLRPAHRRGERFGTDGVCEQHDSRRPDRSNRAAPPVAAAAAQPAQRRRLDSRERQLLRPGAVRPESLDRGQQGELVRHTQPERVRPLQRAGFLHRERHELRRPAAGAGARDEQPRHGRGEHL